MNAQKEAAFAAMEEWLAHLGELGKKPAKLELAGEFDLHEMHYYIFKYKKSFLSPWLLGVCGGYEDGETEHCGHVYSEMEPYDPKTAEEKAVAMVEMIRHYWMEQAAKAEEEAEEDAASGFLGFVLLSTPEWDAEAFIAQLKADWDIDCSEDYKEDANITMLVFDVGDCRAALSLLPAPVPNGEAVENARSNFMWPGAVEAAEKHAAQVVVTVLGAADAMERSALYVKLAATCLKADNALGFYANGAVFAPDFFIEGARALKAGEFPLLNLLFVGIYRTEKGVSAYTDGLRAFGKDELEILDSAHMPAEIHDLLLNVSDYIIEQNVTLRDGETLGYTAEQKLPLTRSEGVSVEGISLKIGF